MTISLPRKQPPTYLKRCQVISLAERHGLTETAVRAALPPGCPARKRLPFRKTDVYIRVAVLEALGIDDTPP